MVPNELPKFVKTTTRSIRVNLFFQKPLIERISVGRFSKSLTLGFREKASTIPETHPAAIIGFKDVKGAARIDDKMVRGWARAIRAPRPANNPFAMIHHVIICVPACDPPEKKPTKKSVNIPIGIIHLKRLATFFLGGSASDRKSVV